MKYIVALFGAMTLNAAANLLMKVGAKTMAEKGDMLKDGPMGAVKAVIGTPTLLFGLTFFAMNAGLYMYALQSKALKISIAYPIMVGGGYALIAVTAYYHPALKETLTWGQKIGVLLILAGIILVSTQTAPAAAIPAGS